MIEMKPTLRKYQQPMINEREEESNIYFL